MEFVKEVPFLFLFIGLGASLVSAERSTYIVHMDKTFMPKAFASHQHWYSNTIDSLNSMSLNSDHQKPPRLLYIYDNAFHGFSALLSKDELEALKRNAGFVSAHNDKVATLDTTHTYEFLSLNPVTGFLASWIPTDYVTQIGSIRLSSDFVLYSGTSMACPHAAGIAALLKGAHPEWSPAAIRSAMITSANPFDNTKGPIKDVGLNYSIATPLAMGAGQINPNSALDPGLIYDAQIHDYINLLCSMNFTQNQISTITRSASYNCSNATSDLNYPSFIALYNTGTNNIMVQNFGRTMTNVGEGAATYKAQVTAPKGSKVTVYPETLAFGKKYDKQSYSLTIRYIANQNKTVTFGSLIWIEGNGRHTVRSPIVVAPTVPVW